MSSGATTSLQGKGWISRAARLPDPSPLDLISDKPNRWNAEGEPTIYVSSDPGLALLESGRHPSDLEDGLRLFTMELHIPKALDLRDGRVREALSLSDDYHWILDRELTVELGGSLRRAGTNDALIVPSAASIIGLSINPVARSAAST